MGLFSSRKANNQLLPEGLTECAIGADIFKQCEMDINTEIKNLVSVPQELYKELYLNTLYKVAEFCQAMPLTEKGAPYSLLANQLNFCLTALKLRRGMLLPKNAKAETIAEQETRWTYAVFSASLFYQLHNIQNTRKVNLHNRQGDLIGSWHPLVGSLYFADTCYSIVWETSDNIEPITLKSALAVQFITPQVLRWLIQDKEVKLNWWDAVTNPQSKNIITEIIIEVANTINKKSSQDKHVNYQLASKNMVSNKAGGEVTFINNQMLNNCDLLPALLAWLFECHSELPNKEPAFFKIEQGLVIHESVIEEFIKMINIKGMTGEKFINQIKSHLIEKSGNYLFRFRPKSYADRRIFQGIVLKQEQLSNGWKQFPMTKEYQFDIPL